MIRGALAGTALALAAGAWLAQTFVDGAEPFLRSLGL